MTGDIEGSSEVRWLMAYSAADRAEFVGIRGTGSFTAPMGDTPSLSLEYELG